MALQAWRITIACPDSSSLLWNLAVRLSRCMLISSTKVSVSSFRAGVALYALATAQRHVFWIGCNLAANPLGPLQGLCHIRAANAIVEY